MRWIVENNPSVAKGIARVSARCRKARLSSSQEYIEQIANGWQRPGTKLAIFIATTFAIDLTALLTYPYRRPSTKKNAA